MTTTYDLVVLGGGAVGEVLADRAKQGGLSVAVVEHELVGGECSYWACMPSKALLRSGMALRAAKRIGGSREAVTGNLDVAAVLARRNSFTHDWNDDSQVEWLEGAGLDLVRGHGRLTGVRTVEVTATDGSLITLTANSAVAVVSGSEPVIPDIPGLADVSPWTSRNATAAQSVPDSLAIIGGGVVACEIATAYASFGCAVTMLVRGDILGGTEPFAAELVGEGLSELGVDIRRGRSATAAERNADGDVVLTIDDGSALTAREVLVATGRSPRTVDIGVDSVGITPGEWLTVDDTLLVQAETNDGEPWLYAVGDVNHRALLTHQGKYQARAAGDVIAVRAAGGTVSDQPWGAHVATADHAAVPQVAFTEPEVASVGLTAEAAEKAGHRIRVVDYEIGDVAGGSLQADGYRGRARAVVDEDRQVLLGVTFVGSDVAELLQSATIAVVGEVPLARLWHAVPAYPTMSEIWLRLLESYGRESA
jgi:pyruvate/2-oxoglutarate dehydrogenase complex dihydrolipoamide dehydrogenase (E3) component